MASGAFSLVSVIISFRNEAEVLPELIRRIRAVFTAEMPEYEIIFVNDLSSDMSLEILLEERTRDERIKVINMARRFGVSECVLAGMRHAKGDAVVYLDADLQDPPELIATLIAKWKEGFDVVYTVRTARLGEAQSKLFLTKAAYALISFLAEITLPIESGDYRLISRRAADHLLRLREPRPYLRGLSMWVGFQQCAVPYERSDRAAGVTHFPVFSRIVRDARTLSGPVGTLISGATSMSLLPLVGFFILSVVLLPVVLITMLLCCTASAVSIILAVLIPLVLLNTLGVGLVAVYLARVYQTVLDRPLYIIESSHGIEPAAAMEG